LVLVAGFARLPRHLRALQYAMAAAVRVVPETRLRRGLTEGVPPPFRADALQELRVNRADVARVMRDGARFDVQELVGALDIPVLVVCGARDRANRPLSTRLADALPRARLEIVADAGHVANLDAPASFTRLLRAFLDAPDPTRC